MRSHAAGHGRAGEPELFNETADEIRRLLHQFAAGFLRPGGARADGAAGAPRAAAAGARTGARRRVGVRSARGARCHHAGGPRRGGHRRRRRPGRRTVPDLRGRGRRTAAAAAVAPARMAGPARRAGRRRRPACARCTPSRAARAWPARCAWARWRTGSKPRSSPGGARVGGGGRRRAPARPRRRHGLGLRRAAHAGRCASRTPRPAEPAPSRRRARAAADRRACRRPRRPSLPPNGALAEPACRAPSGRRAAEATVPQTAAAPAASTGGASPPATAAAARRWPKRPPSGPPPAAVVVRVRAALLDRLVNQAGEVSITRARIDADVEPAAGLAGRAHRQPGPHAPPAARHRAAGRDADRARASRPPRLRRRPSTRWRWTASRASRS